MHNPSSILHHQRIFRTPFCFFATDKFKIRSILSESCAQVGVLASLRAFKLQISHDMLASGDRYYLLDPASETISKQFWTGQDDQALFEIKVILVVNESY